MNTDIFRLGSAGLLGVVIGLYFRHEASVLQAAMPPADNTMAGVVRIMTKATSIMLWGGLAVLLLAILMYLADRKSKARNHDA